MEGLNIHKKRDEKSAFLQTKMTRKLVSPGLRIRERKAIFLEYT